MYGASSRVGAKPVKNYVVKNRKRIKPAASVANNATMPCPVRCRGKGYSACQFTVMFASLMLGSRRSGESEV
jgi:hypothetical protein